MSLEPHLILYSRPGCHLCDAMKAQLDQLCTRLEFELQVVDIAADAGLEQRYGHEIPVLYIDGRIAARHRVTDAELIRKLTHDGRGG